MKKIQTLKAIVVADQAGNILAAHVPGIREGNPPPQVEIVPLDGQVVRQVEISSDLVRADGAGDVFGDYRLQVKGAEAKLVKRSASKG